MMQASATEQVETLVSQTSDTPVEKIIFLVVVVGVTALLSHVVVRALKRALDSSRMPNASIFVHIVRALLWFFALLLVLEPVFGISPTAFVAALGVTSLVVSLGMQDTISNLVGGIALTATKVVVPGDIIETSQGRGRVLDITLRDTRVKDASGNIQTIPNSLLNKSSLTKLSDVEATTVRISFMVAPEKDLEAVALEAKELVEQALLGKIEPGTTSVLFDGMDAFGVRATLSVRAQGSWPVYGLADAATRAICKCAWLAKV